MSAPILPSACSRLAMRSPRWLNRPGVPKGCLPVFSSSRGDPTRAGAWQRGVKDDEVVINHAGASIFTPWTGKARQVILESRILTTRNLVDALKGAREGTVLMSTSAVGYYGGREDDHVLDESSPPGRDFLAEVGVKWEAEALRAKDLGVRVILARFGVILGKEGGALPRMLLGLGFQFRFPSLEQALQNLLAGGKNRG